MAKKKKIRWQDIAPNFSLQIFQFQDEKSKWGKESIDFVKEISANLSGLVSGYEKKITIGKKANPKLFPQQVKIVDGVSFNVKHDSLAGITKINSKNFESSLTDDHMLLIGFYYKMKGLPSWLKNDINSIEDVKHHLAFFCILPPYVGVTSTHESMQTFLSAFLEVGEADPVSIPTILNPVPTRDYENAFINDEAHHLWLVGLHKSTPSKADKKTLSGTDLRHALDPFGENSYTYKAVISKINKSKAEKLTMKEKKNERHVNSIGYSRASQTVWMTRTYGILEFAKRISFIREELTTSKSIKPKKEEELTKQRLGLNYLSKPVTGSLIQELHKPFEISINLNDQSVGAPLTEHNEDHDLWRQFGKLEIVRFKKNTNTYDLFTRAIYYKEEITEFKIELEKNADGFIVVRITDMTAPSSAKFIDYERLQRLLGSIGINNAFHIRFQSGHVLSGKNLFKPQYQDFIYNAWIPVNLKGFNCDQEKPNDWTSLSRTDRITQVKKDKSLFGKMARNVKELLNPTHKDWVLLCHDKAQEIADFIYIEPKNRRVDLIHVKGAASDSATRGVSIDAYQVVCAQAIKNLRHLNASVLYERFADYFKAKNKVSQEYCGEFLVSSSKPNLIKSDCSEFLEALKILHDGYPVLSKKIIVFQPHIRKKYWDKVYTDFTSNNDPTKTPTLRPACMLSTLLFETDMACRKQGAMFEVWSEDI